MARKACQKANGRLKKGWTLTRGGKCKKAGSSRKKAKCACGTRALCLAKIRTIARGKGRRASAKSARIREEARLMAQYS